MGVDTSGKLLATRYSDEVPSVVELMADVVAEDCSADGNKFMALKSDGTLWQFLQNDIDVALNRETAQPQQIDNNVEQVAVSRNITLLKKSDGSIWGEWNGTPDEMPEGLQKYITQHTPENAEQEQPQKT